MTAPERPEPQQLVLVTSAERIVVLSRPTPAGRDFVLPSTGRGAAAAASLARSRLGGEVSGLRKVSDLPDGASLWAARLVGHAPGTWSWAGDLDGAEEGVGVFSMEVDLADVGTLARVRPPSVGERLAEVGRGARPLDVLLGIHAASTS